VTHATARAQLGRVFEPFRAGEWWEHKLAPMLGTGYLTAFELRSSLLDLWPTFVAVLVGMAAAAAYVSLVNDVTDLEADAAAGKYNRLAQRRRSYAAIAIGGVLGLGVAVAIIAWRDDPLALALYAGPWLAFSLYSLPPVRLKARGVAGVLADASGAHLFPHLLIAVAVFHAAGTPLDGAWLGTVGTWALAAGIRGALWHQLGDVEADTCSGVKTFARQDPARARLAGRAAFVIEVAAFCVLLWRAGSLLAALFVIPYALLELARVRFWGVRLIVVAPAPSFRIAMHEYYVCFYPLASLAASAVRQPRDVVVLLLHVTMFRGIALAIVRDAKNALRRLAVRPRAGAAPPDRSRS
jgi:4-hydroxybenzoate polyprenyltransferase